MGKRKDGTHSKGNPIIGVRVDDELFEALGIAAKQYGVERSTLLRDLGKLEVQKLGLIRPN